MRFPENTSRSESGFSTVNSRISLVGLAIAGGVGRAETLVGVAAVTVDFERGAFKIDAQLVNYAHFVVAEELFGTNQLRFRLGDAQFLERRNGLILQQFILELQRISQRLGDVADQQDEMQNATLTRLGVRTGKHP